MTIQEMYFYPMRKNHIRTPFVIVLTCFFLLNLLFHMQIFSVSHCSWLKFMVQKANKNENVIPRTSSSYLVLIKFVLGCSLFSLSEIHPSNKTLSRKKQFILCKNGREFLITSFEIQFLFLNIFCLNVLSVEGVCV